MSLVYSGIGHFRPFVLFVVECMSTIVVFGRSTMSEPMHCRRLMSLNERVLLNAC